MPIEVDFQPVGRRVLVEPGSTILQAAQKAGVGLSAVCGGGGNCGTCVVRMDGAAPISPINMLEESELSELELAAGLRLACQARLLGDTRVDIPPESLTAVQRTQVEDPRGGCGDALRVEQGRVDLALADGDDDLAAG